MATTLPLRPQLLRVQCPTQQPVQRSQFACVIRTRRRAAASHVVVYSQPQNEFGTQSTSSSSSPVQALVGSSQPSTGSIPNQTSEPGLEQLLRADDAWAVFEARLEADLQTVGVTLVAILGVICFWRGVWSLLDYVLGDNPIGDTACILLGLSIILYIRLAGLKIGSFWPT